MKISYQQVLLDSISNTNTIKKEVKYMKKVEKDISEKMTRMVRKRWGDSVVCRIINNQATCELNGDTYSGKGKNNVEALKNVFSLIIKNYELGQKSK